MKLTTLSFASIFMVVFATSSCVGQDIPENKVPSVVVNALGSMHPNAAKVEWEKKNDSFEAEFEIDATEYTVLISATGSLVQSKREIAITDLPATVQTAISGAYKDKQIDDAELLEKDGQTFYQVELEGLLKDTKLVVDQAGQELKDLPYWD